MEKCKTCIWINEGKYKCCLHDKHTFYIRECKNYSKYKSKTHEEIVNYILERIK